MKKNLICLFLLTATLFSFGQNVSPDTSKKEYKNVIGLDASGILRQVLNSNSVPFVNSPYMITYRRIMKSNAIRFGLGGRVTNDNNVLNDSIKERNQRTELNFGIGIEHYVYLGQRWNFYFGADVIAKYVNSTGESTSSQIFNSMEVTRFGYGLSPVLGIQFRVTPRFSISTESTYDITYNTSVTDSHAVFAYADYKRHSTSTGISTVFNAPVALNLRIQF
jgi:hypothetical protein